MSVRRSALAGLLVGFMLVGLFAWVTGCKPQPEEKTTETKTPAKPLTAEIKVDKTTAKAGEKVKYTLTIKNNSDKELTGVKMKLEIPSGLQGGLAQSGGPKPVQPTWDQAKMTYTWDVATLKAGEAFWFDAQMDILPDAPAGIKITTEFSAEATGVSTVSSNEVTTQIQ